MKTEARSGMREAGTRTIAVGAPSTQALAEGARAALRSYRDLDVYQRSMQVLRPLQDIIERLPAVERYE